MNIQSMLKLHMHVKIHGVITINYDYVSIISVVISFN